MLWGGPISLSLDGDLAGEEGRPRISVLKTV